MKKTIAGILKQFWFVILVGLIFISFSVYYAWDTNKDRIPSKSSDGKDVIFSTDGYNYFADEYYDAIYNNETEESKDGIGAIYTLFQNSVLSQSIETTDEMKENAAYSTEQYMAYYADTYGPEYAQSIIESQLKQAGYSDFEDFELLLINQEKYMQLLYDYVLANEDVYTQLFETEEPRLVSQIYVGIDDMDAITEEEQKLMNDIDAALADGDEFSKVAQLYSTDTSTVGGSLGIVLKSSAFDEAVLTEAYALDMDETSTSWIKTEEGFYKLRVDETDKEVILKSETVVSDVAAAAVTMNENIFNIALWDAANVLGLKMDEAMEKDLLTFMDIKEDAE